MDRRRDTPVRPSDPPARFYTILLAGALALSGCSILFPEPVDVTKLNPDPGHEESETGWWCLNGGLPAPHRPEYDDGYNDHPCTPEEIEGACHGVDYTPRPPYCRQ